MITVKRSEVPPGGAFIYQTQLDAGDTDRCLAGPGLVGWFASYPGPDDMDASCHLLVHPSRNDNAPGVHYATDPTESMPMAAKAADVKVHKLRRDLAVGTAFQYVDAGMHIAPGFIVVAEGHDHTVPEPWAYSSNHEYNIRYHKLRDGTILHGNKSVTLLVHPSRGGRGEPAKTEAEAMPLRADYGPSPIREKLTTKDAEDAAVLAAFAHRAHESAACGCSGSVRDRAAKMTTAEFAQAKVLWSASLRTKVAASNAERTRKDREQVRLQTDEDFEHLLKDVT